MNNPSFLETSEGPLVNYVRVHRREAHFTQHELGRILGYTSEMAVSRHERFESIPPFLMALAYQVLFRVQVSEIFPGLIQTVELGVEKRLEELETHLRSLEASGARTQAIERKLEWITRRRQMARP